MKINEVQKEQMSRMIDLGGYSQQEDDLCLPSSEGLGFEGGGISNGTSGREYPKDFTIDEIRDFIPGVDPKLNELFLRSPLPLHWRIVRDPFLSYLDTMTGLKQKQHPYLDYFQMLSQRQDVKIIMTDQQLIQKAQEVKQYLNQQGQNISLKLSREMHQNQTKLQQMQRINLEIVENENHRKIMRAESNLIVQSQQKMQIMREKVKKEHERELDVIQFQYKQKTEKMKLKKQGNEVEMPMHINSFLGKLDQIHQQRVNDTKKEYQTQLKQNREQMEKDKNQALEKVKSELKMQNDSFMQKIKQNLQLNNQEAEKRLREKRQDLQNQFRNRLNNEKMQIQEDFELRKSHLLQENERRRENQKILLQSKMATKMIENEILPENRTQVFKNKLEIYKKQCQNDYEQQKQEIDNQIKSKIKSEKSKFEDQMNGATPSMVVKYLQNQNAELKLKVQNLTVKNNKFVTIGDIDYEEPQTLKKVKQRDTSVPKPRPIQENEELVVSQRSAPMNSEFAITAKLEGISERNSSDFGSKISSGFGGKSQASGIFIQSDKMKEIRQFVAHEIYRTQKKSDDLYKQFQSLKTLREEMMKGDPEKTGKKSLKEVELQYEQVRRSMKRIQEKYDLLKKLRENLQRLQRNMGYDAVLQQTLETKILSDYEYLRQKTRVDVDRSQRQLDETYSSASGILSRAYSDVTTKSEFDTFYQKWSGIINSGKEQSNHFFDPHAALKLEKDDENLKVVKKLQRELNDLKLHHPLMPYGFSDGQKPHYRVSAQAYRSDRQKLDQDNFHDVIVEKDQALGSFRNAIINI